MKQLYHESSANSNNKSTSPVTPCSNVKGKKIPTSVFADYIVWGDNTSVLHYSKFKALLDNVLGGRLLVPDHRYGFVRYDQPISYVREDIMAPVLGHSGAYYTAKYTSSIGAKVLAMEIDDEVSHIRIEFSGEPLKALFPRNSFLGLLKLHYYCMSVLPNCKLSRNDLTIEVHPSLLSMDKVVEATRAGNYCGARKHLFMESGDISGKGAGRTVYIGSPKSKNKKVRIYETTTKHGYDAVRIEVESHLRLSQWLSDYYLEVYESMQKELDVVSKGRGQQLILENYNAMINQFVIDFTVRQKSVGFILRADRDNNQRLATFRELSWWSKFKSYLGSCELKVKLMKPAKELAKSVDDLFVKMSGRLTMLKKYLGKDNLNRLIDGFISMREKGIGCRVFDESRYLHFFGLKDRELATIPEMFSPQMRQGLRDVYPLGVFNYSSHNNSDCFINSSLYREEPRQFHLDIPF